MIIDAHCHAWRTWPYQPAVPDPTSRGSVEQLLFEMDQHGVDQAVLVAARIDQNADNNDYVAGCVRRYPDRLHQFADVDCSWTETYHTPGAAERLAASVARYGHVGFTHYVKGGDDGAWFLGEEGTAFFRMADRMRQIVSLACSPGLHPVLRQVAERFPAIPFLCHHMAGVRAGEPPPQPRLAEVLRSAAVSNIFVKLSGFHYVSAVSWEYPYADCAPVVQQLYEAFGPDRLCWGSDYPVVRKAMTYQQALEAFRRHCPFVPAEHKERILGGTLHRLLSERRS
jgi:L-fuconolactonase